MSHRSLSLLMAGAVLVVGSFSAADTRIGLEDAIAEALAAGPGLKALANSAEADRDEAKAANRRRWGALDGVAFFDYFSDDVIVRSISSQLLAGGFANLPFDNQQLHWGVVAEVPLYLGGKLSNGIEIAELTAEKTAALLEGTRWQVRFNVTSLYAAVQSFDAVEGALARQLAALEETNSRLEMMVTEGKRPEVDRLKVVEELEGARATRAAVRASRRKAGALLLALMGREPTESIQVEPLPPTVPKLTETPAELRSALADVSMVRQADLALEQASSGVKVATSEFIPSVVARGHYLVNEGRSLDRNYNTWAVSLGVVVPLFHGGARFEQRAAAKERLQAAEHALEQTRLETGAHLEDALAEFEAADTAISAAEARVAAGTEAARIEQIRYDTGAGTIEDLLRARAREEGARSDLARARAQALTAGARINSIVEKEAVK